MVKIQPTRIIDELGDLEEFEKQVKHCQIRDLAIVGPVYKSWAPSIEISSQTLSSENVSNVPIIELLRRCIEFISQHRVVTIRQVYYNLVSSQIIGNNEHEYHRISRVLKNGRLAGLIAFDQVVDDTREAEKTPSWDNIEDILNAAVHQYRSDWWKDQDYYVEVWLEKRALRRIFRPITNSLDVPLCIGGGYQSWSEIWEAKERFEYRQDKDIIILYFGDMDPSGKDMLRDLNTRFTILGIDVEIIEVALTIDDVQIYNLPKNPSKKSDTRVSWYIKKYGINWSVELDALPPDILKDRIYQSIMTFADFDLLIKKGSIDNENKGLWRKIIDSHSE